jgi:hypothetical protein
LSWYLLFFTPSSILQSVVLVVMTLKEVIILNILFYCSLLY